MSCTGPVRVCGKTIVFIKKSGDPDVIYVPAHAVLEFSYDRTEGVFTISTALATYVFHGHKEGPPEHTFALLTGESPLGKK